VASRQGGPDTDGVSTDSRGVSLTNAPTAPAIDRRDAASVPSRDPTAYAQTDHFRRRLRQTGRYLSLPLVAHAIRDGQLRFNPADGWRFATVVDGVRTDSPVLVTGWTEVADRETAVASDRWSRLDVETSRRSRTPTTDSVPARSARGSSPARSRWVTTRSAPPAATVSSSVTTAVRASGRSARSSRSAVGGSRPGAIVAGYSATTTSHQPVASPLSMCSGTNGAGTGRNPPSRIADTPPNVSTGRPA